MAQMNLCRLCVDICPVSKSLYEDNGLGNELYKITYKYFHPTIVNMEEAQHLTAICLSCWQQLCDFQSFQTSIQMAQYKLGECKPTVSELIVKTEPLDNQIGVHHGRDFVSESWMVDEISDDEERNLRMDGDFESEFSSDDDVVPGKKCQPSVQKEPHTSLSSTDYTPTKKKYQRLEDLLARWIPTIKCVVCPESFTTLALLEDHFHHAHANEEFYITCCSRKLSKRFDIKQHLLLHNDPDTFRCDLCRKSFTSKKGLKRHMARRHPEMENIKFVCNICGKGLKTKWGLKSHYNIIHNTDIGTEEVSEIVQGVSNVAQPAFPTEIISQNKENAAVVDNTAILGEGEDTPVKVKLEKEDVNLNKMVSSGVNETPLVKIKEEDPESYQGYVVDKFVISSVTSEANENVVECTTHLPNQYTDPENHLIEPKLEIMDVASDSEYGSSDDEEPSTTGGQVSPLDHTERRRQYLRLDDLLAKWMPNIKCVVCTETYPNFASLSEHFSEKHPNEEFYIMCCSRKLRKRLQIKDHLLIHSNPDSFKCDRCPKSYATNKGLIRHMNRRHPETQRIKFVCKICGIGLKSKGGLKLHHTTMHRTEELPEEVIQLNEHVQARMARRLKRVRRKTNKRQKQGDDPTGGPLNPKDDVPKPLTEEQTQGDPTGEPLQTKENVAKFLTEQKSKEMLSEEYPGEMSQPNEEFEIKMEPSLPSAEISQELNKNQNDIDPCQDMPNDDGKYTCRACGKISQNETTYYHHMWFIHKMNLKRLCAYCGRTFKRTRDLVEHVATHQKRDIYACAFCPMTFRKIHNVIAHRRKIHPQESNKNFYTKID